mgnify:CR=1 FL=1
MLYLQLVRSSGHTCWVCWGGGGRGAAGMSHKPDVWRVRGVLIGVAWGAACATCME